MMAIIIVGLSNNTTRVHVMTHLKSTITKAWVDGAMKKYGMIGVDDTADGT